jgi:hypothetical protein
MLGRMRHAAWLSLFACAAAAAGTVYKSIGPDGSVVYTDRPAPIAQDLRFPVPAPYAPPDLPASRSAPALQPEPVAGGEYSGFAVVAPKNEETIHNRDRSVDVDLAISPPLRDGDSFSLVLDGAVVAKGLRSQQLRLTDLERGPHQLEASIYDADGRAVLHSQPIRFYLVTETLIKEPLEAQKEKLKEGGLTLEERVWDKWVQDLSHYQTRSGGDPLPKTAPPPPPVGAPPDASTYDDALETYQKASDRFDETHRTFRPPPVDSSAPYTPQYAPPASSKSPYAPPAGAPSFVPAPPARPFAPTYAPK